MYLLLRGLVKHQSESKNTDDLIMMSPIHSVPADSWEGILMLQVCGYAFMTSVLYSAESVFHIFFFQSICPGSWIKKAYEEIQKATEILKKHSERAMSWLME